MPSLKVLSFLTSTEDRQDIRVLQVLAAPPGAYSGQRMLPGLCPEAWSLVFQLPVLTVSASEIFTFKDTTRTVSFFIVSTKKIKPSLA